METLVRGGARKGISCSTVSFFFLVTAYLLLYYYVSDLGDFSGETFPDEYSLIPKIPRKWGHRMMLLLYHF